MMRVVVHAGMHKTGSSSIQGYFQKEQIENIKYARWTDSNHCGIFILLFQQEDLLGEYHGFKARGPAFVATLPDLKAKWLKSLEEDMDSSADRTVIFSAEDISWPGFRGATERMHKFFKRWTDDVKVVAYARSPLSFALSAFQQMLKDGGMKTLNVHALWPNYRARFAALDDIFGAANVDLRLYERTSLFGGDVVSDFASAIGIDIGSAPTPQANLSLSAEAIALLFMQRRLGEGYLSGFDGAQAGNNRFVNKLLKIGNRNLMFSDELWQPVVQKNLADLKWMEERLGKELIADFTGNEIKISSEEDLLQLAVQSYGAVESALIDSITHSTRGMKERTVRALDLLRKDSY